VLPITENFRMMKMQCCRYIFIFLIHIPRRIRVYCQCYYLAIQRSVWRDIKFAVFCVFFCTVEDISTQDGAIGVKFWLRVEQTPETGTR